MNLDHLCDDPSPVMSVTNVIPAQEAPDGVISGGWATHENGHICHEPATWLADVPISPEQLNNMLGVLDETDWSKPVEPCQKCTEDEFCSDACADADEPCLHGEIVPVNRNDGLEDAVGVRRLMFCLDCCQQVYHTYVAPCA